MTRTEHLLTILAEECAEVAQRVSKALRFGVDEVQPGQGKTNGERVRDELGDLLAVYAMLETARVLPPIGIGNVEESLYQPIIAKQKKVDRFLEFSAARGLVDGQPVIPDYPHPEAQQPSPKE